jgi:restriction system protein
MAIPDYQTLMLPLLRASTDGEKRIADVADSVADEVGLTSEERMAMLPSGRQRLLHNRLHWSKFYMSKAGLIASPSRGRFMATEEARKLLATNPDRINVALLMQYPSFREWYKSQGERTSDAAEAIRRGMRPQTFTDVPSTRKPSSLRLRAPS